MADQFITHKEFIERLYNAAFHFYPYYPVRMDPDKTNLNDKFGSLSFDEFSSKIFEISGTKDPKSAIDKLSEFRNLSSEELERSIPTLEQIERGTKIAEERHEAREAAQKTAKETEEAREEKLKKIYAKTKAEKPKMSGEERKAADTVVEQTKQAPTREAAINLLKEDIRNRVPEEIPYEVVETTAVAIAFSVRENSGPNTQRAVLEKVSESPEKADLAVLLSDQTKTLAELQNLDIMTKEVAKIAYGEALQKELLPDVAAEDVSTIESAGFVPIQIPYIPKVAATETQTETIAFGQTWVQIQLAQIKEGVIQGTGYNPKAFQSSLSTFKPLTGLAKQAAVNKVSGLVTKAVIPKVTTALGTVTGPVGTAIGLAVGRALNWIADRINWKTVKEYSLALISAPFVFLGLVFSIPALTLVGGVGVGVGVGMANGLTAAGVGSTIVGIGGAIASATLGAIGIPILTTLLAFPVVVALILFIINSGAYVVPSLPLTSSLGRGIKVECSSEKGPIGIGGPTAPSAIANRAWEISYDLYQGFWCFWNRSPKAPPQYFPKDILKYPPGYPNLFDYSLFLRNPNPPESGVQNLFWCTWLIVKAYQENGNKIGANLYVPDMYNDFKARGKIIDAKSATPKNIVPGSVVFFQVTSGEFSDRLNHVGVVYSVDPGGIVVVESNNAIKSESINFVPGGGAGSLPGMLTKYFGLP